MELKGLNDPANGGNLVDVGVGMVDGIASYACFVVAKELDLFMREKGQYLSLKDAAKVAEFVMEMVSCLSYLLRTRCLGGVWWWEIPFACEQDV